MSWILVGVGLEERSGRRGLGMEVGLLIRVEHS
jgi:hypothetical protein